MKSEPLSNYKQEDQSPPKLYYNGKKQGDGMVIVMAIHDIESPNDTSYLILYSEGKELEVGKLIFYKESLEFDLHTYNGAVKLSNN